MSALWVEGQVVQLTRRPGARTAYLTLRDPDVDMSLSVTIQRQRRSTPCPRRCPRAPGSWCRPSRRSGPSAARCMLDARQIRPVGRRRAARPARAPQAAAGRRGPVRRRAQEARCRSCPARSGWSAAGRSAAEKDVVENARRRWPAVRFEIRQVAVQGPTAVTEVTAALRELDADPDVDVIVITRGGGSVEDLLPFSNETLRPGRRRRPHPRRQRHRPRRRHPPARPRRRRPRLHPHRRRQARGARRGRASAPRVQQAARPAPGAPSPAGSPASAATWSRCAAGRSWPTRPP